MNLHIFTTGEGSPYGLALVPVIKVSSRTALAEKWPDLIDVDAGTHRDRPATIEDVGWRLFRLLLEVASGPQDLGRTLGLSKRPVALQPRPGHVALGGSRHPSS